MTCAFCGQHAHDVAVLVADPDDQRLCDACLMTIADGLLATFLDLPEPVACSFCGHSDRKPHGMGLDGKQTICAYCTFAALRAMSADNTVYRDRAKQLAQRLDVSVDQMDVYLRESYE